jgi:hypothetical protein
MRWQLGALWGAALVLAFASQAATGDGGKPRKPQLDLRASPRVALSAVQVLLTGQLKGGPDLEEFYCPGQQWDWGDGTHSAYEADCAPYEDGTALDRFFSARHAYHAPGSYNVRLTLRRADRTLAAATVVVMIHGQTADASEY